MGEDDVRDGEVDGFELLVGKDDCVQLGLQRFSVRECGQQEDL